jgi:hypothetical protein
MNAEQRKDDDLRHDRDAVADGDIDQRFNEDVGFRL